MLTLALGEGAAADSGRGNSAKPGDLMNLVEAQMKWREKVEAENRRLKEELELMRSESAVLSQTLAQMAAQRNAATNALRYLAINDYLMDNRATMISSLHKEWTPKRDALFTSLWSQGRVLEFQVVDLFLYQTNVVARADFLWMNQDGSGGFGQANIWMDPLKEFVITGTSIQEQTRISAMELASLREGPAKPKAVKDRSVGTPTLEARSTPKTQEPPPKLAAQEPWISEQTKDALTAAGIAVATQVAAKAAITWIDEWFKNRAATQQFQRR